MTAFRAIRLVAGREVSSSLQKRSFWVSVAITAAVVLAIAILPGVLSGSSGTTRSVGLTGDDVRLSEPLRAFEDVDENLTIEITEYDEAGAARQGVLDGDVDVAVVDGVILVEDDPDEDLVVLLDQAARIAQVNQGVDAGTIDSSLATELASPQVLRTESLDPADPEEETRQAITIIGVFIILAQMFGFGWAIASGIVEEKSSRVVEVLLAKVRAGHLLAGKVVGIWLLTTAQMLGIAVLGLGAAVAVGTIDLPPGWLGVVATLMLWYFVAYIFYACVFAICGALAASAEELQSTTTPATFLVMAAYGGAVLTLSDPGGRLATAASYFPPTAPVAMPVRAVLGEAGAWEMGLSAVVTVGAGMLLIPIAARIYRGSVLATRQTKLGVAWRTARS